MDKNEGFIASGVELRERYFGKIKGTEADCLEVFHVSTPQPSLKLLLQLPCNFARKPSGKNLAGHEPIVAVIEENEGKEVSFIKYLHRNF
jgi:hypothetical protein